VDVVVTTVSLVLLVLLLLGALTVLLSWTAGRHDRLHIRLTTAATSLDLQLADRVTCTMRIATSPVLDPASALLLLAAADEARAGHGREGHEAAESRLSQSLRAVLGDEDLVGELWRLSSPEDRQVLADLASACERVRFAASFRDELVTSTLQMRQRRLVAWLRLAGHAPWPTRFAFDDAPPEALLSVVAMAPDTPGPA
jgi:hypothetical protein